MEPEINYCEALLTRLHQLEIPVYDMDQIKDCGFDADDHLGGGTSMDVYKARLENPNPLQDCTIPVAVKVPKGEMVHGTPDDGLRDILDDVRQELKIMKHLGQHPNIMNLYGVAFRELKPIFVVEFAAGNLQNHLMENAKNNVPINWVTKSRFCCEVAEGLSALHAANIIHGDVNAYNILLFASSRGDGELVAKFGDFGFSATRKAIENEDIPNFLAPECTPEASSEIAHFATEPTKDNYSYGIFVWQVAMNGEVPYSGLDYDSICEIKNTDKELKTLLDRLSPSVPDKFRQMIVAMTQYAPLERAPFDQVTKMLKPAEVDEDALSFSRDAYVEAKKCFEEGVRELPHDIGNAELESLEFMAIPSALKTNIFRNYEKAAEDGDPEGAFQLALCYMTGFGTETDKLKAVELFAMAAENGSLNAIHSLCQVDDIPRDPAVLFSWFLLAAKHGSSEAQRRVARCYADGFGVKQDTNKERTWITQWLSSLHYARGRQDASSLSETALHRAARNGNIQAVRSLLEKSKADVDAQNNEGRTPLHLAAEGGHIDIVKALGGDHGADLNSKDGNGWTPLYISACNGHINVVKALADDLGADVNLKAWNNRSALHPAAENGHIDVVKALAGDYGLDPDNEDRYGVTALHLAAANGHIDVVKMLAGDFRAYANAKDTNGRMPLCWAVENGHVEIVKVLVNDFTSYAGITDKDGRTLLHHAANKGHIELMKVLANDFKAYVGAMDKNGQTALHLAAVNGNIEVVKALTVDLRAYIGAKDSNQQTPLHLAVWNGNTSIVKTLAGPLGVYVDRQDRHGLTPLHLATIKGHVDIVKVLGDIGADMDLEDGNDKSPLHLAAENGHLNILKVLANDFNATMDTMDSNGQTPLHLAAENKHIKIVRMLVGDLRTYVGAKDNKGRTPLHLAARNGYAEVVKALAGALVAYIDRKDQDGQTPLHMAAKKGHTNIVKMLAGDYGANVNIKDISDQTPLHVAAHAGNTNIVKILVKDFRSFVDAKDKDGRTPLHMAIERGRTVAAEVLVTSLGADLSSRDKWGRTPLRLAEECNEAYLLGVFAGRVIDE